MYHWGSKDGEKRMIEMIQLMTSIVGTIAVALTVVYLTVQVRANTVSNP